MEKIKTLILTLLVFLSLFLSYKLLYRPMGEERKEIPVSTKDLFTYKRMYTVAPNREILQTMPTERFNETLVKALEKGKKVEVAEGTFQLKDKGIYVEAGFDIPVQGLFRSFKKRAPDLPFEYIRSFYINNAKKELQLETEEGMATFPMENPFSWEEPKKYIQYNDDFSPAYYVGVNEFAVEVNPVPEYNRGDRYTLAEDFLKELSLAETEEEKGWLYTSSDASLFLGKDGQVEYRRRPSSEIHPANLYDSLLALKQFITDSPLSFSSYRIVDISADTDNGEDVFVLRLLQGDLPQYGGANPFIDVQIANNRVIYFRYYANYLRNYDELFRGPSIETYAKAYMEGKDPFPFYKRQKTSLDRVVKLQTLTGK